MKTYVFLITALLLFSTSSCATRVVTHPAANVTLVKTAPKHYKKVTVQGKRYYFWNGNHYQKTRRGYVLVRI